MTESAPWSSVELSSAVELIVGWRSGKSNLDGLAVEISPTVAEDLWGSCLETLQRLAGLTRRPFGGSPHIEPGEEYLAVPLAEMPRGAAAASAEDTDPESFLSDLDRMVRTQGLRSISAAQLDQHRYLFYAVVCIDRGRGDRLAFVRQINPHRVAKAGRTLAVLGDGDRLQRLEQPLFVFEASYDLVVGVDEVAVLRLEAFNRLYSDLQVIAAAAPTNAQLLAAQLPGMSTGAADALATTAGKRPSLARRLQRLSRPGAIPSVTPSQLLRALQKHGLDPSLVVANGQIAIDDEGAEVLLDLLEELYYETDFTGEHRRADRYSRLEGR